jgi:hypothetical protein
MTNARSRSQPNHPLRRLRAVQEVMFWLVVAAGGFGLYIILTRV